MSDDAIEFIHAAALIAFTALLFVGSISTVGRVVFYRAHGFRRPRLLVRDAIMLIGFALSFGLVLAARAFGLPTDLRNSPWWVALTDTPAIIAVTTYVYYELFVIERGQDDVRDWPLREPVALDDLDIDDEQSA